MTSDERIIELADRAATEVSGLIAGKVSNSALMVVLHVDARTAAMIRLCRLPRHGGEVRLLAMKFDIDQNLFSATLKAVDALPPPGEEYIASYNSIATVMIMLACNPKTAAWVRSQRLPRNPEDLQEIASTAGVDVQKLQELLALG